MARATQENQQRMQEGPQMLRGINPRVMQVCCLMVRPALLLNRVAFAQGPAADADAGGQQLEQRNLLSGSAAASGCAAVLRPNGLEHTRRQTMQHRQHASCEGPELPEGAGRASQGPVLPTPNVATTLDKLHAIGSRLAFGGQPGGAGATPASCFIT